MKRYNLINNSLGWLCFLISAVCYMLTLEPTASFWDCPEFILQGFKLEVGHPPGNPIFMLAARFFANFAFGDPTKVALMVNAMSGLLSAGTILLLFWTITHLVKRLTVSDDATTVSPLKMVVIFASGFCGAMMFAWSDTFWFSAVEGEVYAFSSFCTALVFWLILKWENRADMPHSDKYLILIAYVIGISIAVHLLNLLCIPAIVLVIYYRKWSNTNVKGSLIALLISFAIVAVILYGLVPGFIEASQYVERFCVNTLHMGFNMGVLIYAILTVGVFIWAIHELYAQRSARRIRISLFLALLLSGLAFIGSNLWISIPLFIAAYVAGVWKVRVRILTLVALSTFVIFIGYSSYALILIRSSAHTPMNQNTPENVFALSSYLNREQYGDRPLLYGETFNSRPLYEVRGESTNPVVHEGQALYSRKVKENESERDEYVLTGYKKNYVMTPELNMVFPRIYSSTPPHPTAYSDWIGGLRGRVVDATQYVDAQGNPLQKAPRIKPTFGENLSYFLNYQLSHMYWRYFLWNFAGRQNDIQGNGEVNQGHWISGIPFIDNPRLGDQSLLPDEQGKGNAGHNVFYLLPLIMGIIGLGWQAFTSKRGIEQFWVVFFLFFMTGIAIVLYLNQPPAQPRERDYAFAGSFYAYAIWVGMGVAGLWRLILALCKKKKGSVEEATDEPEKGTAPYRRSLTAAVIAAVVGVFVPLQVVSQTWDDHDRSGRYAARDFGFNYLNSLDPNAIIFTNGDNDTFPLWYAQEVEGVRTDVKVVNLSYLTTDWYADQIRRPSYDSPGIEMQAQPKDYAYDRAQFMYIIQPDTMPVNALSALRHAYSPEARANAWKLPEFRYPVMYVPVDTAAMVKAGRITPAEAKAAEAVIPIDMLHNPTAAGEGGLRQNALLSIDMLATSAANGWNRPIYFAMTVPDSYYLGLSPYLRNTGMAYEVSPLRESSEQTGVNTDKMYQNITEKFAWGGLDKVTAPGQIYLDETVRRMVTTVRSSMVDLATALINEAVGAEQALHNDSTEHNLTEAERQRYTDYKNDRYTKARNTLELMRQKLPENAMPFALQIADQTAQLYQRLGAATGNEADTKTALDMIKHQIDRYAKNVVYYQSLSPSQYASLPNLDQYIDRYHFMDLIDDYGYAGGDIEALEKELTLAGVNLQRQVSFRQAIMQQQYGSGAEAAPAASDATEAAE